MEVNFNKEEAKPSPQTIIPANAPARRVTETTRVPMSLPTLKLAVPEVPGYFLYWHLGKNVNAALKAGYTFVDGDEVEVEQHGVANGADSDGSTDMGSRLSISAGKSLNEENEAERLYLMKLPQEWRDNDVAAQLEGSMSIAKALRSGSIGTDKESGVDRAQRYIKTGQDLFYPQGQKVGVRPR